MGYVVGLQRALGAKKGTSSRDRQLSCVLAAVGMAKPPSAASMNFSVTW